jgi:Xaa-Pro dipeptidase
MLRISPDEHRHRMELLKTKVADSDLDVFLVSAFDSIYYLTGAGFEPLERPFFLLVRPRQAPVLLVPKLDQAYMRRAYGIREEDIHAYWEYPAPPGRGWPERLRELIRDTDVVGVEPSLSLVVSAELKGKTVQARPLVEELRLVKSAAEIAMIRRAARYADLGVEHLLSASYWQATVAEGFSQTRRVMLRILKEVKDWEPLTTKLVMATWAAPRSAMPHSIPDLRDCLGAGPHVALVLTRVNGYAAECERTYFTAPPTSEVRKAFDAMMQARRVAFDKLRPGVSCSELDGVVNAFLRREGYGSEDQRLHRTGHGIGLSNHEAPWIAEGSKETLAENMVISIEPGIYLSGTGGFRHSDTVLITRDGFELLNCSRVDVESLTIHGWKPLTRLRGWGIRRGLGVNGSRTLLKSTRQILRADCV